MLAGLRSRRQAFLIAARTRGSGGVSTRAGCFGSAPLATVIGATGAFARSEGRKPYFAASSGVILSARYFWKSAGARLLRRRHPRGIQREERRVGVERPLLGIDRHELVAIAARAVEVEQRHLLHRHRAGVARPLLLQLVRDEQRRVPVVDDRALDVADLLARLRVRDVLLGQPLLLAQRGEVLGDDRRQPRGGEVGAGVDELEGAELRLAERRPALARGRQLEHVGEAELLLRPARAPAPSAPTSRSPAACARSRAPPRACTACPPRS